MIQPLDPVEVRTATRIALDELTSLIRQSIGFLSYKWRRCSC